jgi:hypothetical protein
MVMMLLQSGASQVFGSSLRVKGATMYCLSVPVLKETFCRPQGSTVLTSGSLLFTCHATLSIVLNIVLDCAAREHNTWTMYGGHASVPSARRKKERG